MKHKGIIKIQKHRTKEKGNYEVPVLETKSGFTIELSNWFRQFQGSKLTMKFK